MSSILDALKKSEAERQRGLPPTIGSSLPLRRQPPPRKPTRWWLPLAALAAIALAWAGGLFDFGGGTPPDTTASSTETPPVDSHLAATDAPAPEEGSAANAAASVPPPAPARSETGPSTPTATASVASNKPVESSQSPRRIGFGPFPPRSEPATPKQTETTTAPEIDPPERNAQTADPLPRGRAQPEQAEAVKAAATQAAPTALEKTAPSQSAETPSGGEAPATGQNIAPDPSLVAGAMHDGIPTIYELPFAARRSLPDITVTMHMYSDDPDRRFALVNGMRVSDGQTLEGGVEIVRVLPDGVQIRFESTEFILPVRH